MTKNKTNNSIKENDIHSSLLSGSSVNEVTDVHNSQTIRTVLLNGSLDDEGDKKLAEIVGSETIINLRDETEVLIKAQLEATHNATTKCFAEAMAEDHSFSFDGSTNYKYSPEVRNMFMRTATKLVNAQANLMASLDRHRGKSTEQKITVQYVNISEGGQAIIGDVRRGHNKNRG